MNTRLPAPQADTSASLSPESPENGQAHTFQELLQQPVLTPKKVSGIALGFIRGFNPQGLALLEIPALEMDGVTAQSMVSLDTSHLGNEVAIGFADSDPARLMVLGLIIQPERAKPSQALHMKIDGERVTMQAQHELELRCGDAAILLTCDGNIQIRGTYITSHASATQRILGGAVSVN